MRRRPVPSQRSGVMRHIRAAATQPTDPWPGAVPVLACSLRLAVVLSQHCGLTGLECVPDARLAAASSSAPVSPSHRCACAVERDGFFFTTRPHRRVCEGCRG